MMPAGAQRIARGIHRGQLIRARSSTQKQRPARISITKDYRKISRRKIIEKRRNFSRNFASCRLLIYKLKGISYFFLRKAENRFKSLNFNIINISNTLREDGVLGFWGFGALASMSSGTLR